ncbi:MAG: hypothetical protein HOP33_09490 [Verrucomicrobia bacterium]|nr:hypothetical protein [Verrucomicrobiota bacterium]
MPKMRIVYVTSSSFKAEENRVFTEHCQLKDGTKVGNDFHFEIRSVPIKEVLEVDLRVMVQAEVVEAYSQTRVPCIVEHAGLIFPDLGDCYPGGLTKPMWNTLGDRFLAETNSAGRPAIARAVVAYCDGMSVKTFVGETRGQLAKTPRGDRKFYWDTVFEPDDTSGTTKGRTYAEIVADPKLGLVYKIVELSQSSKAMMQFLEFIRIAPPSSLWE